LNLVRLRRSAERKFPKGGLRSVMILLGGTAGSQIIYMLALPVLTRIYTPSEMGVLNIFQSVLAILVAITALRYDIAIVIPSSDILAMNLVGIAFVFLFVNSALVACILFFFSRLFAADVRMSSVVSLWWVLSLGQFGAGGYSILNNWMLRKSAFKQVAYTKITQVIGQIFTQITLGFAGCQTTGLLLGDVVGRTSGFSRYIRFTLRQYKYLLKKINSKRMRIAALVYSHFPIYSTPAAAINVFGQQCPAILMGVFFGGQVTGWFGLMMRVCAAPVMLVGKSIGDVYTSKCPQLYKTNPSHLKAIFKKTLFRLFAMGILSSSIVGFFGPKLFSMIFGYEWYNAGLYARYAAAYIGTYFCYQPFSNTLTILEKQRLQLLWDVCLTVVFGVGMSIIALKKWPNDIAVIFFSGWYAIMYSIHVLLSYRVISAAVKKLRYV
jgi:O-antigen/teichoic acid export membrane protein